MELWRNSCCKEWMISQKILENLLKECVVYFLERTPGRFSNKNHEKISKRVHSFGMNLLELQSYTEIINYYTLLMEFSEKKSEEIPREYWQDINGGFFKISENDFFNEYFKKFQEKFLKDF